MIWAAAAALAAAILVWAAGPGLFTRSHRHAIPGCGCVTGRRTGTGERFTVACAEHRPSFDPLPPDLARYDKELSA